MKISSFKLNNLVLTLRTVASQLQTYLSKISKIYGLFQIIRPYIVYGVFSSDNIQKPLPWR